MRIPRPKLNYANVIATIALFVALGGAAVAAGVPKNSVGTKQLKRGAVKAGDLRRGSVTSGKIRAGAVTAGKLGPDAVLPGNIGNGTISTGKLSDGAVTLAKLGGDVAPLVGALRSGQTLRGVFGLGATTDVAGETVRDAESFQFPLRSTPAVSMLEPGQTSDSCRGLGGGTSQTPHAAPGQLCVYMTKRVNLNATEPLKVENATRLGFGLVAKAGPLSEEYYAYGQWAVTAS